MSQTATPLPLRNDTVLGVCEALGQDLGFHANWLRIALGVTFYFAPVPVIATYLGLGLVVAATRYFYPSVAASQSTAPAIAETAAAPDRDEPLPLAA